MNKFWNFTKNENDKERTLRIDGDIVSEASFWGDDSDVIPAEFRQELESGKGDINLWINSRGGDVFAAAQIYTMLKEYPGKVKVKIDGLAASAASVIAMAGDTVEMSPVSMLMIHNPLTICIGNQNDMKATIDRLDVVKETIMNAYNRKTGISRDKLSEMMDAEKYMDAKEAVELGFADSVLYDGEGDENKTKNADYRSMFANLLTSKMLEKQTTNIIDKVSAGQLYKRLNLISH
ncbi:MAG: Clp protease ClpP [Selenomonadaceae bacterium]|nr:Clp protease ClpP [Selenomonadaceae bacterium]